eukprot:4631040-Prymnesium_polylepis.1
MQHKHAGGALMSLGCGHALMLMRSHNWAAKKAEASAARDSKEDTKAQRKASFYEKAGAKMKRRSSCSAATSRLACAASSQS